MPQIIIDATDEQIKAVEAIVMDSKQWLQDAWDGKANSCLKRTIRQESNLNPDKMTVDERKNWVKGNAFKSRKQKKEEAEL